jgi:small-conductance mechanosensitive channel
MVALFIVAFAMAFSVLMSHDPGFTDIPNSLLTTFVMMTGEVDFRDTFLGYAASAGFNFLQRLLLVVFLILVTIGITNLLTGLAVGDTADIMERSREENLLRKVRSIKIIST